MSETRQLEEGARLHEVVRAALAQARAAVLAHDRAQPRHDALGGAAADDGARTRISSIRHHLRKGHCLRLSPCIADSRAD